MSHKLFADFFQIFFVWLQYNVFKLESKKQIVDDTDADIEEDFNIEELGGKNNELLHEKEYYKDNPFHDFVSDSRSSLDKLKYGVYMYSFWFVLAIVYITGTSRISLLCMGYVILSFFFLWYGQTFLMKPIDKLLKS